MSEQNGHAKYDAEPSNAGLSDRVNSLSIKNDSPIYQNVPSIVIIDIDNNSTPDNEENEQNKPAL